MSGEYEQIPEKFIRDLEGKRRRLVQAQEENDVNLDALVDFLYPDTAHLVFELLQNAEDAEATAVRFDLRKTKLSFTHNGRPFSKEDLKNITNYFKSEKYEKEDKIGRFGIGFKSVFACTETPRIYSPTVAFEIVDRIVPRAITQPASSISLCACETVIELPFNGRMKPMDEVRREIRLGLARMSVMSVLHLQNIESIKWRTDDDDLGSLIRTELGDGVVQIRTLRPTVEEVRCFLRFREPYAEGSLMYLDVVFELEEKEREQEALPAEDDALADRFRIVPADGGSVAVFFPATKETSNLRFHLHAPFIPELSRASIKEHPDNDALIGRLAELVARSLPTIRDVGLLDREFLGVLPNSRDSLPEAYRPFHEAVLEAMREEPLVPMQGGSHGRASRLVQGPKEFKNFLGLDDIHFLMSGWDYDTQMAFRWGPRTNRSAQPSSNYQGWAVSAIPGNTEVDRLLTDLKIDAFKVEYLVPPDSKGHREIREWFVIHDAPWHRAYYALLAKHWDALRRAHNRLRKFPMVRTRSGKYRNGAECRFANDEGVAPEGVMLADPDTYSHGNRAEDAKKGLERLGVSELDDESRAVGILDKYYGESGRRPNWDEHGNHLETFIKFVREGQVATEKLGEYSLLLSRSGDWLPPGRLYAGKEYSDGSAAPYFRHLRQPMGDRERCEIDSRYRNLPGFSEFAKRIGVAYTIPISGIKCDNNPMRDHLRSGGGERWTYLGIDRDWHVPNLELIFERTKDSEIERSALAKAIHATLDATREHTWPPPTDCPSATVSGQLVATFRMNRSASCRAAPSQLVFSLRKHPWVPQMQGRDGLVFVTPREARPELLPEGFAFDSGWSWIKATEFAEEPLEPTRRAPRERLDPEAEARELEAWFGRLPDKEQEEIRERYESRHRPRPKFDTPKNPERRLARAVEDAHEAADRKTEIRERSILEGAERLRREARTMLRARYEQHARSSLCQVSDCDDRSFKLENDTWYFEAVRFLGLEKESVADHLALCPLHAAMFQHAGKSTSRLEREFAVRSAAGNGGRTVAIPVVLAGETLEVLLAPKHVIDLRAALGADGERDSEG